MDRKQLTTLLYVDDEEDIREIVQMALEVEGLTVHTCGSGAQALTLLKSLKPDLVILDVMMSGLDGLTTLAQMRADASSAHIPVAFMTAKVMPQEVARFRQLGAIGVISKPFDPMQLGREVLAMWESAPRVAAEPDRRAMQSRLTVLASQFLTRSSQDVTSLQELASRAGAGESEAFALLEQLAHRISGAGASLGFAEISHCAAEVERLAKDNADDSGAPDADTRERLVDSTARLAAIVQQSLEAQSERV